MDSSRRIDEVRVGVGIGLEIPPLCGRGLRFVLLAEIRRRRTMTVAEMAAFLDERGYGVIGRASKTISDALRWEIARGRVIRVRRGVYGYGRAPRTTARRVWIFADRCDAWIVAARRSETPPQSHPPWEDLGWLWAI